MKTGNFTKMESNNQTNHKHWMYNKAVKMLKTKINNENWRRWTLQNTMDLYEIIDPNNNENE